MRLSLLVLPLATRLLGFPVSLSVLGKTPSPLLSLLFFLSIQQSTRLKSCQQDPVDSPGGHLTALREVFTEVLIEVNVSQHKREGRRHVP